MWHEFTPEQINLQESIGHLARSVCSNSNWTFQQKWQAIAQSGIIGISIEKEKGGAGLGAFDLFIALEALARSSEDNGFNFALAAHTLACVVPIAKYGSVEQLTTILPQLIDGRAICANAMTESESGSNPYDLQTKAVELTEGQYQINGCKTYITNGAIADYCLLYAETSANKGFFGGLSAFLIDKSKYKCTHEFEKMGLESAHLSEIRIENCLIDSNSLLNKKGAGAIIFNESMEWERTCIAGLHIGAMERVMKKTIQFVKSRKSNGISISKYQSISYRIADMQVMIDTSRALAYNTARMIDKQLNVSKESSTTKLYVSTCVKNFMLQALDIFAAAGYIKDFGIEKEVRDALAATIYSGTNDIQKNIILSNIGL